MATPRMRLSSDNTRSVIPHCILLRPAGRNNWHQCLICVELWELVFSYDLVFRSHGKLRHLVFSESNDIYSSLQLTLSPDPSRFIFSLIGGLGAWPSDCTRVGISVISLLTRLGC